MYFSVEGALNAHRPRGLSDLKVGGARGGGVHDGVGDILGPHGRPGDSQHLLTDRLVFFDGKGVAGAEAARLFDPKLRRKETML